MTTEKPPIKNGVTRRDALATIGVAAAGAAVLSAGAGEGPDWGWRTSVAQRPSGELVLQMTNIAPWGERARAVRMVFARP